MTADLSAVRFELDHLSDGSRRVTPMVNGRSLIELVRDYETERGFDVPGGYDGLILDHFRFGDLELYLTGRSAVWPGAGRAALLGCNCGEVGCWPLFAGIKVDAQSIVWDSFEQPHRPQRDYSRFGPFVFARGEYEGAVRDLVLASGSGA